jgi:hypothetical protein
MTTASVPKVLARLLLVSVAAAFQANAQITADTNVRLKPIIEHVDLVTDLNVVGDSLFVCTQPGLLLRKSLSSQSTTDYSVFLDLRSKVGALGTNIPGLGGLGYPTPGTYDERGLLGFTASPRFASNGTFWVWYSAINEHSASPPGFFQWLVSTSAPWDMSQYDHVDYLVEYQVQHGAPVFQRTVLKLKRPYFNHTGFQSLVWSAELGTLLLGLGDGGSEYDPNNLAQNDDQLSGKLLKIDLAKLNGRDFTSSAPVATFTDLKNQHVPSGAFVPLLKGLRNPSKVSFARSDEDEEDEGGVIKTLANTGQDTIEFIHAFKGYGLNFGFRPWEGIFPTSFEFPDLNPPDVPFAVTGTRVISYGLEASRLPNYYRPMVEYTHLDPNLGPNANTGSTIYKGTDIPGLKGQLVFTDWISFKTSPPHGLLMHAPINGNNLQQVQTIHLFNVDFSRVLNPTKAFFYTSINTDAKGERIFLGVFNDLQFITNQRDNPPGSSGLAGGVYEVLRN